MKILVAAVALAVAAAAPALADPAQQAQAKAYAKEQLAKKKVVKVKTMKRSAVRGGSPYSTNPEHDVYVNGQYIGSDPDPRIRWTLKREYCQDSVDGC